MMNCFKSQCCMLFNSSHDMKHQPPTGGLRAPHTHAPTQHMCRHTYKHALQLCNCVGGLQAASAVSILKCILSWTIKNCLLHAQNIPCHFPSISHGPV